jgi:hypothetical protein
LVKQAAHARRGMWQLAGLAVPKSLLVVLLAAAVMGAVAYWLRTRAPDTAARVARSGAAWLLLGAATMFAADLISLGGLQHWYYVPALPALALSIAVVFGRSQRLAEIGALLLVCAALARVPHTVWVVRHNHLHGHIRGEAADALRDTLPAGTRVGAWNGGMLGYYSKQHVVMLDGLANDVAYYRRVVEQHDLEGYLADEHISALAVTGCRLVWVARELAPEVAKRIEERVIERRVLARDPAADPCHAYSLWQLSAAP